MVVKESMPRRPPLTWQLWRPVAPTFRAVGRAFKPADRPLEDLAPSHAATVLKKVSALTWLALVVLTWLTAQAAYRVAQLFRPGRRGWQLALLAVELALMLLLMQLAPPVLIAFVWVLADSQKLTNLFTNLHRLRPPFRLFPASHSEYLWDPVVCKLFTQVALSREFTGP